jgi:DNA-binding PadR family transcriptional regulator
MAQQLSNGLYQIAQAERAIPVGSVLESGWHRRTICVTQDDVADMAHCFCCFYYNELVDIGLKLITMNIIEFNNIDMNKRHSIRKRRHEFWKAWQQERDRLRSEGIEITPRHWRDFFQTHTGRTPEQHWAFKGRRFSPWRKGDSAFNPFVANILSKGGGLLPQLVLHLLSEKARYGNELMDAISAQTNGQWIANPGAIYPLMSQLEAQELIRGEWEDPQKRTVRVYELTDAGREELERLNAIMLPRLREATDVLEKLITLLDTPVDQTAG